MKQALLALTLVLSLGLQAQSEADRNLATLIADFAQMSKEKVLFTSVECNKAMLESFNIQTNEPSLQKMLEVVNRLYLVQTTDRATAELMLKRINELQARGYLKNYTETKQQDMKITIFVPKEMRMAYLVALTEAAGQSILLVVSDDNFFNLVERLRVE